MSARLGQRGAVTAEFAVVLPAAVLVLALGAAVLGGCARAVLLQDGTADAARLAARGETVARVQQAVAQTVTGARAVVETRGDLVCVTGTAPSGSVAGMPSLRASSCALAGGR